MTDCQADLDSNGMEELILPLLCSGYAALLEVRSGAVWEAQTNTTAKYTRLAELGRGRSDRGDS